MCLYIVLRNWFVCVVRNYFVAYTDCDICVHRFGYPRLHKQHILYLVSSLLSVVFNVTRSVFPWIRNISLAPWDFTISAWRYHPFFPNDLMFRCWNLGHRCRTFTPYHCLLAFERSFYTGTYGWFASPVNLESYGLRQGLLIPQHLVYLGLLDGKVYFISVQSSGRVHSVVPSISCEASSLSPVKVFTISSQFHGTKVASAIFNLTTV